MTIVVVIPVVAVNMQLTIIGVQLRKPCSQLIKSKSPQLQVS